MSLIDYLAVNPKAGVVMPGTGGVRKLRWGRADRGKSGGVRAIYYWHSEDVPLFLFTIFGKGEKENLSKKERNELDVLVKIIMEPWRRKK